MWMKKSKTLFAGLLVALATVPMKASQIEYISIQTEGRGVTVKDALHDALTQAVGSINGISIDSTSLINTSEVYVEDGDETNHLMSQTYQETVASQTKGQIKEFSILSKRQDSESKGWILKVDSSIAKYKMAKSAQRKRIAVLPLQARLDCCRSLATEINPSAVTEELTRSISDALVQSRKFTVLDRDFVQEKSSEKRLLSSGSMPADELAKLGQELFSDLILVGVITSVRIMETTRKMATNDLEITQLSGKVQLAYRIIDVPTSQIQFSNTAILTFGPDELSRLQLTRDSSPAELVFGVLKLVGKEVGEKVLNSIYPVLVESITGKLLVLGQGGDSLRAGQEMQLIMRGEKVRDSYTKESLGRTEEVVGTIEITSVTPKQSYAKILTSTRDDFAELFKPKLFLVRPISDSQNDKNNKEIIKKKRVERKEKFDDDW